MLVTSENFSDPMSNLAPNEGYTLNRGASEAAGRTRPRQSAALNRAAARARVMVKLLLLVAMREGIIACGFPASTRAGAAVAPPRPRMPRRRRGSREAGRADSAMPQAAPQGKSTGRC